jgi:hypothetical protein
MKNIQPLSFVCTLILVSLQPAIAGTGAAPQAGNPTGMNTAAGATPMAVPNNGAGDSLSPVQIMEKTRAKYASLNSYSDGGYVVATLNDTVINTSFITRLARTNFYLISWQRNAESFFSTNYSGAQAVWSSGCGNFLDTGLGPQTVESREIALAKARENSGGAAIAIPRAFFNLPWGSPFGDSWFAEERKTDEKVGGVDCYVLITEGEGRTRTLWIGKQDFLIRQIRGVMDATILQETMAKNFNWDVEQISGLQALTLTETHTNVVANQPLSKADFMPPTGP